MDYGKIAYLKVEELEARTAKLENRESAKVKSVYACPRKNTSLGAASIARAKEGGEVCSFCRATVRVVSGAGSLVLKAGGVEVGRTAFSGEAGEVVTAFIMGAATVSRNDEFTLGGDGGECVIESVQLLVVCFGAGIGGRSGSCAVDCAGETWYLVDCSDGDVALYAFAEENFALASPLYVGEGDRADVSASESGAAVAYVDSAGNVFLVELSPSFELIRARFVCSGASSVALHAAGNSFVIAAVKNGEVTAFAASEDGTLGDGVAIDRADDVLFVKGSPTPMLVTASKGKNVLRLAAVEYGAHESPAIAIGCEIVAAEVTT